MKTILSPLLSLMLSLMLFPAGLLASDLSLSAVLDSNDKVEFKAYKVRDAGPTEINKSGYSVHEGKLYMTLQKKPKIILDSGAVTIDGKRVELDVSGLADAWIEGDGLPKRFVRLDRSSEHGVIHLTVCFVKGGAEDFMVTWDIFEGTSIRTGIIPLGDRFPDWVVPAPEFLEQQKEKREQEGVSRKEGQEQSGGK